MEQEKEERYLIDEHQIQTIIKNTSVLKEKEDMLDITCGYDGFNSFSKYGFICRIRQKGDKKSLEVKNYTNNNECMEQSIKLENVADGVNYLRFIGMTPYLYLKRSREIRKYKNLKIFIDRFDILGDFVEIEYQDSPNAKQEMEEFKRINNITGEPQDMYGGIVKDKLEKEENFREIFNKELDKIIKNL